MPMVMGMTDVEPPSATPSEDGNAKPYSVSELAFALKRTLEDAYDFKNYFSPCKL